MNQFTKPMPIFIIQKHCPFVSLISIILQMAYIRLYKKIHWHFEWWTDAKYTTGFYWLRCLRRQFWSMTTTTLWLIKLYFFCTFFFFKKTSSGFIPMQKRHKIQKWVLWVFSGYPPFKVTQVSYEASCPATSQMHADQPFKWPLDFAP